MKTPFFICGLPRCRLAWLSNLFTTDTTLCLHEPFKFDLQKHVEENPEITFGIADSTLVFRYKELRDRYPEAPWLYVNRELEDSKKSLIKAVSQAVRLFGSQLDSMYKRHREASVAVLNSDRTMVAQYNELDAHLSSTWNHLLPDVEFNRARATLLQGLRVEQIITREKIMERLK